MARKTTKKATTKKFDPNTFDLSTLTGESGFTLLSDSTWSSVTDYVPTGLLAVDKQLNGGLPFSRFTEVYAPEGVGKSMLALQVTAMSSKMGAIVIWIDVEGTASKEAMDTQGIDIHRIIVKQPDGDDGSSMTVEGVGESIEAILNKLEGVEAPVIIIWDSIGQTPAKKEIENGFDNEQPGLQAKAITKMIKKVAPTLTSRNVLFLGINQARDNIGGMSFIKTIDTTGGRALKHYSSVRFELGKGKPYQPTIKGEKTYVGHHVRFKLKKSKVSVPFTEGGAFLYNRYGLNPLVNTLYEGYVQGKVKGSESELTVVNPDGEATKLKRWEAYDWAMQAENFPYIKALYQEMLMESFPDWYPPLENTLLDIEQHPLLEGLRAKYESLGKSADDLVIDESQFSQDSEEDEKVLDELEGE